MKKTTNNDLEYFAPSVREIDEIKANCIETINKYFLLNLGLIRAMAISFYLRKWRKRFSDTDIDELTNEVYINFSKLDFEKRSYFLISLRDVFFFFQFGGEFLYRRYYGVFVFCESLDTPIKAKQRQGGFEEKESRVNLLRARKCVPYQQIERKYVILQKVVKDFLTKREFEIFQYRLLTGYSAQEIADEVGRTKGAILSQMCTMTKALKLHYAEILERLKVCGITKANYYIERGVKPEDYEEIKNFYDRRRVRGCINARKSRQARQAQERANSAKEI